MIPSPPRDRLVDGSAHVTPTWLKWLTTILAAVNRAPQRVAAVTITGNAAVSATAFPVLALDEGWYRVTMFARFTTAAGVSNAVQCTIRFLKDGVACAVVLGVLNVLNTTDGLADSALIYVDTGTIPTYEWSYASNPAGVAVFDAALVLEQVDA